MAAEPAIEPTLAKEEFEEDVDDGEESDVYDEEGDETYEQEEDEEDVDEGADGARPENMTALLLGETNGSAAEYGEDEEDEDEDGEYHENAEGTAENLSSIAGSKRGADELDDGDAYGEDDDEVDEDEGEVAKNLAKKARV